jgi:hypothetical protein
MFRLLLASLIAVAAVPAFAEIIVVDGNSSHNVRIMRGAPDRCTDGPVIIRLKDAASAKTVRCAAANPVVASNVTINNTIAIVVDRNHKRRYMRRH